MPLRTISSGDWPTMDWPAKVMVPWVGLSTPAMVIRVVVFPAPLTPINPTISP